MKKSMIFVGLLAIGFVNAQDYDGKVGINTSEPKATLDVKSTATDKTKGILTPQVSGDDLKTMTGNLTADQHGMISFATSGVTTTDNATANVQFPGFHRFNIAGTEKSWIRLEPSGLEKIKGEGANIGWRLIGMAGDSRLAPIGNRAIDMGFATSQNTEIGATGEYAFVVGANNKATNWMAVAIGEKLVSSGRFSVAMGYNNQATKDYSFAAGGNNQATGIGSVVFGQNNKANNNYTFVSGLASEATHPYGVAMGYNNKSKGEAVIALGGANDVSGTRSVALGNANIVTGNGSFAAGFRNEVLKNYGVAIGFRTVSSVNGMIAMGASNTLGGKLFVVGNGNNATDDSLLERSDAFTVLNDARVGIDIDNFETTTSDAKLQVNGKILANSLAGTGDRPVYADENGVLKIGTATSSPTPATNGVQNTTGMACNDENRGKMNFGRISIGGKETDAMGFCMKNGDNEFRWYYIYGGAAHTVGTNATFGQGL